MNSRFTNNDDEYDLYIKTRDDYLNLKRNQSNLLDKYILTLSMASLGFSITYVKTMIENDRHKVCSNDGG